MDRMAYPTVSNTIRLHLLQIITIARCKNLNSLNYNQCQSNMHCTYKHKGIIRALHVYPCSFLLSVIVLKLLITMQSDGAKGINNYNAVLWC